MDSFSLRGIKTTAFKSSEHCNGGKVVEFLNNHPKVKTVYYQDYWYPYHEELLKTMSGFGGTGVFPFVSQKKMLLIF
jgi:cystathionine beta-lyase